MNIKLVVLDFDGTLTNNHVYTDQNGVESVRSSRADGMGIARLQMLGIPVAILSSELNPVVQRRAEKLGIEAQQTKAPKFTALFDILTTFGTRADGMHLIQFENVAYMGNDINDLECLKACGLPAIPADAHESVKGFGFWQSKFNGGDGAVREFCDAIADGYDFGRQEPSFMRRETR